MIQLVYTKTVNSVKRALIGSSNFEYPVLFTSEQLGKKWRPGLYPWLVKKSSKLIFWVVYYLTVLVIPGAHY